MWIAVANAVSIISGSHGKLDRHAMVFDFLPSASKRKNVVTNAIVPTHIEPMCARQLGSPGTLLAPESRRVRKRISARYSIPAPLKHATASATRVESISCSGFFFLFATQVTIEEGLSLPCHREHRAWRVHNQLEGG